MKPVPLLFALWLLSCTLAVLHGAPFPKEAAVSLQFPEHPVIGGEASGKLVVQNNGTTPLQFAFWDDLNVEVKDAQGHPLPPIPSFGRVAGFFAVPTVIQPGKSAAREFYLPAFVDILTPGTYTITVWSGLGWEMDKSHPSPTATIQVEFRSPTPKYAAAWVHALCTRPKPPKNANKVIADSEVGVEASDQGTQLERLRDPHYLAPLRKEVEAGNTKACFGIASLLGIEATEVLLKLAGSPNAEVAKAAMTALLRRLPLSKENEAKQGFMSIHGELETIHNSWPEKLDTPLLELAEKILRHTPNTDWPTRVQDPPPEDHYFALSRTTTVSAAASIVAARGSLAQMPALMAATDRALSVRLDPRADRHGVFDDLPAPLPALIGAIDTLRHRGWIIKPIEVSSVAELQGKGGLLALLRQLADPQVPKPEDEYWKQIVAANLQNDSAVIKENALRAIPQPFPPTWEGRVNAALEDPDWGVVVAACQAAGVSGRKSFVRPLAQVLESVHESDATGPSVREAATKAAVKLGGGVVLWEAWANLLVDEQNSYNAVWNLCIGTIDLPENGGSGNGHANRSQRFLMRDAWREFLHKHDALLDRGERVPHNDPSITPILTGLSFGGWPIISMHLPDGSEWPKPDIWKAAPSVPGLPGGDDKTSPSTEAP